jgi:hypothetical protein
MSNSSIFHSRIFHDKLDVITRCISWVILVFLFIILVAPSTTHSEQDRGNETIKILDVKFEPIHQGKNEVKIEVVNLTSKDQVFVLDMQVKSPNYGRGMGWGRQFFHDLKPEETRWINIKFKIQGPVTDQTKIWLTYYNPPSKEELDYKKSFYNETFLGENLPRYKETSGLWKPASKEQKNEALKIFSNLKELLKNRNYKDAWSLFSEDYINVELNNKLENFQSAMDEESLMSKFLWRRDQFLELHPETVYFAEGKTVLSARRKEETWQIDFLRKDGTMKVDWIGGYTPDIVRQADWENALLPQLENRETEHFDIYYYKDSTAANEIQKIIVQREKAFREISAFLGEEPAIKIKLVFFEDEWTKQWETGHQGMGWAYKTTVVEVYNEKAKLDPYHEIVHILMSQVGNPPALFNEGFAVYISELLGGPALLHLGGDQQSISERVLNLIRDAQLIDLTELITYTEIGSEESQPKIAYPLAASFVKFLIEKYGRDKFINAYKTLKNSSEKSDIQDNRMILEQIYDKSLQQLKKEWQDALEILK